MFQILTPSGVLVGDAPFDIDTARRLYRAMVFSRLYDRKSTALQKQGRLATYAPFEGQEAAQVGSAAALDVDDWMVATYRDAAAMWMQGYPLDLLFAGRTGDERGGSPPEPVRVLPPSITVGGHMVHAVGLAWAERLKGTNRIALTSFGDGATSEGDFHEAMNFAGAFGIGCVFVCQNNGWAISMPRQSQTASETIAQKAIAYGIPGVQVDGNDPLAMYRATSEALDRARRGEGPTLIEAVTYRLLMHTTSDDPKKYRDEAEVEAWWRRDPIPRLKGYLQRRGIWDDERENNLAKEIKAEVDAAVERFEQRPPPKADAAFDHVLATPHEVIEEQRTEFLELVGRGKGREVGHG